MTVEVWLAANQINRIAGLMLWLG